MALQGTAVGQECLPEAANVKTEFVGVKEETFGEESGIVEKTNVIQVIIKEERDVDYTKIVCEKDEEEFLDVYIRPGPLHGQAAVQLEPTRSTLKRHHALDAQYQEQREAPSLDESRHKPTQDKDNQGNLPSTLVKMASDSDESAKKGTKRHRRKPQVSLHSKLLESQLEMVKIMNKNAELELNIENAIRVEKLKQERLKAKYWGYH